MLRDLSELRRELERGLSRALLQTAGSGLDRVQADEAAREVLCGRGLPDSFTPKISDRPVCSLVSFDADRIQGWVFASERVQVAKGASLTLDRINQRVGARITEEIEGICGVVYSAGGGGVLFARAAEDRGRLEEEVRQWLEKQSHELTFTVVSQPLYARDLRPSTTPRPISPGGAGALDRFEVVDGLRGALVRLQVTLREAKEARPRFGGSAIELKARTGAASDRCSSCGRRPPSPSPYTDDRPETWCDWCQGLRRALLEIERAEREEVYRRSGRPLTFSDLAGSSNRSRRYLGFIAVDGNGMGNVVQRMQDFLQLRAFSEATLRIYEEARNCVEEVLGRGFLESDWDAAGASLSLLSGGDEITLVLPAAAAPVLVSEILRRIESGFDDACRPGQLLHEAFQETPGLLDLLRSAGAAAGMVAARPQFPVRLLRHYAEDLQKQAKRVCGPGKARSAVAWTILTDTSPLLEGLAHASRTADLQLESHERLLREAEAAARVKVPASALWRVLSHGRLEAESIRSIPAGEDRDEVLGLLVANFFRYQMARNPKLRDWWEAVQHLQEAAPGVRGDEVTPWFQAGGLHRLEKLVELLSLEPFPRSGEQESLP